MADGDYEREDSLERRIRTAVHLAARPLRAEIEALRKHVATLEQRVTALENPTDHPSPTAHAPPVENP